MLRGRSGQVVPEMASFPSATRGRRSRGCTDRCAGSDSPGRTSGASITGRQDRPQRHGGLLHVLDQPKVGDLHASADDQQVLRLDIEVLQREPLAHVIQGVGGVAEARQTVRGAGSPAGRAAALLATVLQARIGQFGDNNGCPSTTSMHSKESRKGWRTSLDPPRAFSSHAAPSPRSGGRTPNLIAFDGVRRGRWPSRLPRILRRRSVQGHV